MSNKRKAVMWLIIGIIIGTLAVIGRNVSNDERAPVPTQHSDGAQFREWLCSNSLPDDGC